LVNPVYLIFLNSNAQKLMFSVLVIQLAKISGFSPIITTTSIKHAEALKGLGADVVLARDLSTEELKQEISKHTLKPISLIYDAVSLDSTLGTAANLLAPNGTLVTTRPDVIRELDQGKTIIREVSLLRLEQNVALLEDLFQNHLSGWVEKGLVQVRISCLLCENYTNLFSAQSHRNPSKWSFGNSRWLGSIREGRNFAIEAGRAPARDSLDGVHECAYVVGDAKI